MKEGTIIRKTITAPNGRQYRKWEVRNSSGCQFVVPSTWLWSYACDIARGDKYPFETIADRAQMWIESASSIERYAKEDEVLIKIDDTGNFINE